jgi:hypothetical protein
MSETVYADWLLENLIIVDEADLRPKAQPQKSGRIAPQNFTVTPQAQAKFDDYVVKRNLSSGDIRDYLKRAWPEQVTNELRHAFSDTFKIKPGSDVAIYSVQATENMTLCFIVSDNTVIEIVSWRGLRQLRKRAMHTAKVTPAGKPEAERVHEISKTKFKKKILGGLIRQERCPRDRWNR